MATDINKYTQSLFQDGDLSKKLKWLWNINPRSINEWRTAIRFALADRYYQNTWPYKYPLIEIYEDALLDPHLSNAVDSRKAKVKGESWSLIDENGIPDPEAKKLLQKKWFADTINIILDALFFGYSTPEFQPKEDGSVDYVTNINRRNVIPEYNIVRETPTDETGWDLSNFDRVILIDTKTLGLFVKAVPEVLQKRYAASAWTEHCEKFSTKMMHAKTDVNDAEKVAQLSQSLVDAGRERMIITAPDEEVFLLEQSSADTYQVYKQRMDNCDAQVSKLILGATMLTDSGGSYSQANVHKSTTQELAEADQEYVSYWINDKVIPMLLKFFKGYEGLKNRTFKYNLARQSSMTDRIRIAQALLPYYNIEPRHIEELFNVEVIEKLQDDTAVEKPPMFDEDEESTKTGDDPKNTGNE